MLLRSEPRAGSLSTAPHTSTHNICHVVPLAETPGAAFGAGAASAAGLGWVVSRHTGGGEQQGFSSAMLLLHVSERLAPPGGFAGSPWAWDDVDLMIAKVLPRA